MLALLFLRNEKHIARGSRKDKIGDPRNPDPRVGTRSVMGADTLVLFDPVSRGGLHRRQVG